MDELLQQGKKPVPFSQSPYWKLLRDFYNEQGPSAWRAKVPYFATNNMKMATLYAQAIVAYYLDWVKEAGEQYEPLHIIELGAGSGRFSYYLLIALEKVAKLNQLPLSKFKVILSDFAEENIKHWLAHSQFQPYFEQGVLDCMVFDIGSTTTLRCLHSKTLLSADSFSIPPWVIGHYVLDSLPIDVFLVKNAVPYAVNVALQQTADSPHPAGDLRNIGFAEKIVPLKEGPYQNPFYNKLVISAAKSLQSGYFSFPVVAFNLLDSLNVLLGGKYVFSCLDKGSVDWNAYARKTFPSVFYHANTFSFDVNFCLLRDYVEQKEEASLLLLTQRQSVKWFVFCNGFDMPGLVELKKFAQMQLEESDPVDQTNLYDYVLQQKKGTPLPVLLSYLSNSCWDPIFFEKVGPQLVNQIADAGWGEKIYLFSSLKKVEKNFFHCINSGDIYLVIGRLYHEVEEYDQALVYFEKSCSCFGDGYAVNFAFGRCYFSMGDSAEAARYFSRAQKFKVSKQVTSWLDYLKKK